MDPNQNPTPVPTQTPDVQQPVVTPQPQDTTTQAQAAAPVNQPTPVAAPITAQPTGSKALAIWSLVLSILAFLGMVFFFIAGPLAFAALVIGIIALAKRKPGKGMSIAGVVISGLTLILIPFVIAIVLTAYSGIQEKAKENLEQSQMREETSTPSNSI